MTLHTSLAEISDSDVMGTKAITKFLAYKWDLVKRLALALTIFYFSYLVCLYYIPYWYVILVWMIIHVAEELFQMRYSHEGFFEWAFNAWNIIDVARILTQAMYIYHDYNSCPTLKEDQPAEVD
jgi:hypothetical protein